MAGLQDVLSCLVADLDQLRQRWALIGGLAVSVRSEPRTTRDITARLLAPGERADGTVVDLLFASSGVEPELVRHAEQLEVLPGLVAPVATLGYLLAVKVLAGRPKDLIDIEALLEEATRDDVREARDLLGLIHERGYSRERTKAELLAALPDPANDMV